MDATYPRYSHQDSSPRSQHALLVPLSYPIQQSNPEAKYFSYQDTRDSRQPQPPSPTYSYPDEILPTTPDDGAGYNPVAIAFSDSQYESSPMPESGMASYLATSLYECSPPPEPGMASYFPTSQYEYKLLPESGMPSHPHTFQSLDPRTLSSRKAQGFSQPQSLDVPRANRGRYYSDSESGSDASSPGLLVKQERARSTSIRSSGSRIGASAQTKTIVATTKIRDASKRRRSHPAKVICQTCHNDFTTTFALSRHIVSHTGRRDFPCTKTGCPSRFSTDSGRTRHERSPTLHRS
ncbi:hypothetical protein FIBSPDRAFT_945988 [Athelia psychrophila]|uniref:C2H2-type domain-containing protein n=1 Tax=Athelia psychrophila TaxID=1759441 RepID=A0A166T6L7_9AGAM|nr:hypothetical protein FIBSPDRAFT_945988 [Fibularhizoctonia sp. CBS 109695]